MYRENRSEADHTLYLLKTLYFLVREKGKEVNVGLIYTDDELVREAFEHRGIPQSVLIKDGRTYYMNWA